MASFYADENFRYPVVEELRRLGPDVLTSQETGRAGQAIADEIVLDDARAKSRILLTQNRDDFKKLHRDGLPHHGIVVCTYDRDAAALSQRIDEAVSREEPGGRWLVSVVRPNTTPQGTRKAPVRFKFAVEPSNLDDVGKLVGRLPSAIKIPTFDGHKCPCFSSRFNVTQRSTPTLSVSSATIKSLRRVK